MARQVRCSIELAPEEPANERKSSNGGRVKRCGFRIFASAFNLRSRKRQVENIASASEFLRDVMKLNMSNFRVRPDETTSNKLDAIYEERRNSGSLKVSPRTRMERNCLRTDALSKC